MQSKNLSRHQIWETQCGHACLSAQVAFVPQTAFIFGGTVRDNILFGLPYEESRYQKAVQAAALGPDLVQLPGNDIPCI